MSRTALAPSPLLARRRSGRLLFVALGAGVAVLLASLSMIAAHSALTVVVTPFAPTAEDGVIPEDDPASLDDGDLPAIARLRPALLSAMRAAAADAASDGIRFEVTSGWRSEGYQRWLLDDAIRRLGSEEAARAVVATPDRSRHVTGDAIDVGPAAAQQWLMQHGARYGLCRAYANESWHFEFATTPGGQCPAMRADAEG